MAARDGERARQYAQQQGIKVRVLLRAPALPCHLAPWSCLLLNLLSCTNPCLCHLVVSILYARPFHSLPPHPRALQKHYGSYDELLADPEIDVVYVGLPNGLHVSCMDVVRLYG